MLDIDLGIKEVLIIFFLIFYSVMFKGGRRLGAFHVKAMQPASTCTRREVHAQR